MRTRDDPRGRRFTAPRGVCGILVKPLTGPGTPALSAQLVAMKPGATGPAIFHRRTHEFFYVLGGSARGRVGRMRVSFRKGDCMLLPAGTVHRFQAGSRGILILDVFSPGLDSERPDVVLARR